MVCLFVYTLVFVLQINSNSLNIKNKTIYVVNQFFYW